MSNVLSLMVAILTTPYIVIYVIHDFSGLFIPIITLAPQVLVYAATPAWNRRGPDAAAIYLLIVWIAYAFLYCWYFGRDSGLQYFFLPGAAASMLVCGADNLRLSGFITFVSLIGLVIVEHYFAGPASFLDVSPAFISLMFALSVPFVFVLIFITVLFAFSEAARAEDALAREHARSEMLLKSILPERVALRLKAEPDKPVAETLPSATILFADIVSFTPRAANLGPEDLLDFLNTIFGKFDALAATHGLERIKTVGDSYMAAIGLEADNSPSKTAEQIKATLACARAMHAAAHNITLSGKPVKLRIGIHNGPVMAGVIGTGRIAYDAWGDTVNLASRMEQTAPAGRTQITAAILACAGPQHSFDMCGTQQIKGYGKVETWLA